MQGETDEVVGGSSTGWGTDTTGEPSPDDDPDPDPATETGIDTDGGSGSDSGGDPGEDPEPAVAFCRPGDDPFELEAGGTGAAAYVRYQCALTCEDPFDCAADEDGYQTLPFVVDGMGGHLRWQSGAGLLFLHNGGTGTSFPGGLLVDNALAAGQGVAMVRWDAGAVVDGVELGWTTRPDPAPTDFRRLTGRVATVMEWTAEHLGDGRLSTAGCSAGAYVTFAARLWHGLDDRLDYQLFVGGPPFADVGWGCGDGTSPGGRCVAELSQTCETDEDCPGPVNRCAAYFNSEEGPLAAMADSAHLTSPDCAQGNPNADWDASGFFTTDGDWSLSHPVDFVLNVGPGPSDAGIGPLANAWDIAQALDGDAVGWHTQPGVHCQAFGSEETWSLLEAGLQR